MRRILVSVFVVLGLVVTAAPASAAARITVFTVDPVAYVTADGNTVIVSGTIECPVPHRLRVRATVEQGTSKAEGFTTDDCNGSVQTWRVYAIRYTQPPFHPNGGAGCARGQIGLEGGSGPVHTSSQICLPVTLMAAP